MSNTGAFYVLQPPYSDEKNHLYGQPAWAQKYGRARWADEVTLETVRCPVYPDHQRAGNRIGNLIITLPSQRVGDFVWSWYSDCMSADRTLCLFLEAGLTGFTVNPVGVRSKTEKGRALTTLPILWELVITGNGGDADPNSGIHPVHHPIGCTSDISILFHHNGQNQ